MKVLGISPRAPVYGPRFVNTDFSFVKDFPLPFREAMNLQFRAEFFNLLNHPQFFLEGLGDSGQQDISTPSSFGVINNTVTIRGWCSLRYGLISEASLHSGCEAGFGCCS